MAKSCHDIDLVASLAGTRALTVCAPTRARRCVPAAHTRPHACSLWPTHTPSISVITLVGSRPTNGERGRTRARALLIHAGGMRSDAHR